VIRQFFAEILALAATELPQNCAVAFTPAEN
jgi:hypothetical protein